MQYVLLGNTGLIVSRLSFGAMLFTDNTPTGFAPMRSADADAIINQALEAGINFFDTSDIYAFGESERILGKALAPHRDGIVLATKVACRSGKALVSAGLSRRHILWSIDESLRRLGTDWVDVYIAHVEDPRTPLEETLQAFDDVVRSGKARYIGFSNWSAWKVAAALELQKANGWASFTHGQMYYSLLSRDIERDTVPMMAHYGIGLTVWSPLCSGFLSGKYTRENLSDPANRFGQYDFMPFDKEAAFALVDEMRTIAAALGATVPQVALSWLLAKPAVTSILLGASKGSQLSDNLGALDVRLDDETITRLDSVTAPARTYPQWTQEDFADKVAITALGGPPPHPFGVWRSWSAPTPMPVRSNGQAARSNS